MPVTSGKARAFSLNDWPVSRRLFAVIAVALLMGLAFGGLRVAAAESSAGQFGQVSQLATLGQRLSVLVQDLQNERDQTLSALDNSANVGALTPLYNQTNTAIAPVQQAASAIGGGFPANIQGEATTVVADIAPSRMQVLRSALSPTAPQTEQAVITNYDAVVNDMLNLADQVAQGVSDATLTSDVRAFNALGLAKEQASQQRALLNFGFNNLNGIDPGSSETVQLMQTAFAREFSDESQFQGAATPAEQAFLSNAVHSASVTDTAFAQELELAIFGNVGATPAVDLLGDVQQGIGLTGSNNMGPVTTLPEGYQVWDAGMGDLINSMQSTENLIGDNILNRASQLQSGAKGSALITGVITAAVLLLVLLGALLVARSLVLPLRRLREGALDVAQVQLPERVRQLGEAPESTTSQEVAPIAVLSADEIGQVARAFDQVHQEAVRLAGEEAVLRASFNAMFVNLSRRSQSLIERLSRMIDSLEQNEDDPDRLSNLFSMDHLVTRMRRNSENLLLLAGHESARKWSEPVPLADITRAAISEIEQYSRVVLNVQPGVAVTGQAVSDVVHLLAELIENATIFSPKDTQVMVSAQELTSGGVLIEVTDKGIGVSESRLAEMNWRLDNPPMIDVSVSRHMGLFAVARLAERHKIRIRLRPANPQGLTALVWLPDTVIDRTARSFSATGGWQVASPGTGSLPQPRRASGQHTIDAGTRGGSGRHGTMRPVEAATPEAHLAEDVTMPVQGGQSAAPVSQATSNWFRSRHTAMSAARMPVNAYDANGSGAAEAAGGTPSGASAQRGGDWGAPAASGWGPDPGAWTQGGRRPSDIVADPVLGEQTKAGLPMRVPKANLIPGSAGGPGSPGGRADPGGPAGPGGGSGFAAGRAGAGTSNESQGLSAPLPQRSPELARSRLSGFQRGARRAESQSRGGEGTER